MTGWQIDSVPELESVKMKYAATTAAAE